jgi:hypothetical protein
MSKEKCVYCGRDIGNNDYVGGGDKKCQGNCRDKIPPHPPRPINDVEDVLE